MIKENGEKVEAAESYRGDNYSGKIHLKVAQLSFSYGFAVFFFFLCYMTINIF